MTQRARIAAEAALTPTTSSATQGARLAPPEVSAALAEPGTSLPPELQAHAQRILRTDPASLRVLGTPPEDRRAELAALIAERGPPAPAREDKPRTGILGDGSQYKVLPSGNVEVTFPPARDGRLIIHDADDLADIGVAPADPSAPVKLPTVDLKPTGEQAVQRETKRLVAYNTPVVAVFKPEHLEFDKDGTPLGVKTLKPIAVTATTLGEGKLVQTERNVTTVGASRTVKETNKEKEIQGTFSFSKGPDTHREKDFDKLERAVVIGRTLERSSARVSDATTGNTAETTSSTEFSGVSTSTRGKARDGTYVLDNQATGATRQKNDRVQTFDLASGRTLVVSTDDDKDSLLTQNKKDLDNQGLEYQALLQKESKTKRGLEISGKRTRSAVYAVVPVDPKDPDGPLRRVLVGSSTARTGGFTLGKSTPRVDETLADSKRGPVAVKTEDTRTLGVSGTGSVVTDSASGLRAINLAGNLQAGSSRTLRSTRGPDVPSLGVRPPAGQAELAKVKLGEHGNLAINDTGVRADVGGSTSRGLEKLPETKKQSELFGIFCMETIEGGTKLAGVLAEGRASAEAQRGGKGAQLAGGQVAAGVSGNFQAGWLNERTLELKIKPDPAKIPWPWVRSVVEIIEPVLDLKFKGHTFAGLELKGEARAQAGREVGRGASVSGSAFLGFRAGADIDGSLLVGRVQGGGGSALGSVKGGLAAILGGSASFKYASTLIDGKVVTAAEGSLAFPVGLQANLRAEVDAWRLAAVGANVLRKLPDAAVYVADQAGAAARSTARAASNLYHHDDDARAQVAARAHEAMNLGQRVALVKSLLAGHTAEDDQRAILTVLEDAKRRSDLEQLVKQLGDYRLRFALDGPYNDRYHELLGR